MAVLALTPKSHLPVTSFEQVEDECDSPGIISSPFAWKDFNLTSSPSVHDSKVPTKVHFLEAKEVESGLQSIDRTLMMCGSSESAHKFV